MSLKETPEWNQYRKRLNTFITSSGSGMVLDADEEWYNRYGQSSSGRAGFKLQNGQIVKKFITIWELFDHREEFDECIKNLAKKALEIRQRVHFSKIVTATPTSKELSEYLFDLLQQEMSDQELLVSHFGNYPTLVKQENPTLHFKDENVLILTDVVNSGYLIKNMAEMVIKNGGKIAAILAIIITNNKWIQEQETTEEPVRIVDGKLSVRLHSLADFAIEPLQNHEYDEDKIIPIDYSSVLPERRSVSSTYYAPAFSLPKMFEHLEKSEAIDFGFYEFDEARFTCAFVLPKLLTQYKDEIWQHIREPIIEAAKSIKQNINVGNSDTENLLVVTTYKRKDLLFKDYIQDCLAEEGYTTTTAVTLKRGVTDTPYLNLTLGSRGIEVKGKVVVLALATLSTHEKLRNIVSLLVDGQVKKIIVVCLMNRMGPFTTSFIRAIERFTKRVKVTDTNASLNQATFTDFHFSMVYSFLDIRQPDLPSIGNELDWLFSRFRNQTKVASFMRLCDRIEGYFHPKTSIDRTYQVSPYNTLESSYTLRVEIENESLPINVMTQESKIALMTYNLALNRDFEPILQELVSTLDRRTFIHLYGLLLSDIHYLRFTGTLRTLKSALLRRLQSVRLKRFEWEEQNRDSTSDTDLVREWINAEVYLIFGLGIIAHHESHDNLTDLSKSVDTLLFCDKTAEEWISHYPLSLWEYFSEERIFFTIAFLLHGLFPEFHREDVGKGTKNRLDDSIQQFKSEFNKNYQVDADSAKGLKAKIALVNNNLDLMLTETGKHDHPEKHQIVRYLQREVLRPREGHNPIFTTMGELIRALDSFFENNPPGSNAYRFDLDANLLAKVDDALSGTSSLHMIARSVQQLFFFTPSLHDQQKRYISSVGQEGFSTDVDNLMQMLNEIRQRRRCSKDDRNKLISLDRILRSDFYDSDSSLRITLLSYVVSLDESVERMLNDVNAQLNKEGFSNLLLPLYEQIRDRRKSKDFSWPVLTDYHLLRETLRNLFWNLKHSFPEQERSKLDAQVIQLEFEACQFAPYPDKQLRRGVALKLKVKGLAPRKDDFIRPENTISDQLLRIKEFGGEWSLYDEETGEYLFVLKLISRFGFVDRHPSSHFQDSKE